MSDTFRFETFVDVHGSIFNEYLSSVTAKLSKEDKQWKLISWFRQFIKGNPRGMEDKL